MGTSLMTTWWNREPTPAELLRALLYKSKGQTLVPFNYPRLAYERHKRADGMGCWLPIFDFWRQAGSSDRD